jgi:5'-nucleotidase
MNRRDFLTNTTLAGGLIVSRGFNLLSLGDASNSIKLTILHTNDVHSRIEPFPMDGSKNQGLGGAARRASVIKSIREKEDHVLLLDAGDIFQGTPYFNFFGGELEVKLMSSMGYDGATMGNHDFDAGIEGFEKQLVHANFPFIISNYDLSDTVLNGKTLPYKLYKKGGLTIGVFGLGIELDGLVPASLYGDTQYLDPLATAKKMATKLKLEMGCDYVICLSHLGYKYQEQKVSDTILARETEHIDLIIGGHTHTFLDKPERVANRAGQPVLITQVGWAGILLGRMDVYFERNKPGICVSCKNILITPDVP